jgi:hypothetical protein
MARTTKATTKADPRRAVIRLQLDVSAKQALDALCGKRGMTQIAVLSRVVQWFAKQDEVLQASVLGLLSDEHLVVAAQRVLDRLARCDARAAGKPG